jgi:hypothetical protein
LQAKITADGNRQLRRPRPSQGPPGRQTQVATGPQKAQGLLPVIRRGAKIDQVFQMGCRCDRIVHYPTGSGIGRTVDETQVLMKTTVLRVLALSVLVAGTSSGCSEGQQPAPAPSLSAPGETAPPASTPPSSPSASATRTEASTPPTTSSQEALAPAAEWKSFTDSSKTITFDVPASWTTREDTRDSDKGKSIRVLDESGIPVAMLQTELSGFGGACGPDSMVPYHVLVSISMDLPSTQAGAHAIPPRFVFRVQAVQGKFYGSYGITDSMAGTDGTACMIYNLVSASPANSYMFGDSLQILTSDSAGIPPKVFSSLEEANRYVAGERFLQIQKMITSLRIVF